MSERKASNFPKLRKVWFCYFMWFCFEQKNLSIDLDAAPNWALPLMIIDLTRNNNKLYFWFQIGRSSESPIDFVVMDTVPGNKATEKINTQSTISRFACRLLCIRDDSDLSAMIFAAGFDSSRNIFQGKFFPINFF